MGRLENTLNNITRDSWRVWGVAFLYACIVSVFVQFILLPFLLPRYHAGGGLFIGAPDCIAFNRFAVDLAAKIKTSGWSVWKLRAYGQTPIGIAAYIYALTWSKLWVLIPLNAVLHASAFLILFRLINLLVKSPTRSFLCALPFLIFPSNLQWVTQLHKDGYSILGVMFILQGVVSASRLENYISKNWFFIIFRSVISFICGFILIWLVRPKLLVIMQPVLGIVFSLLIVIFSVRIFKKLVSWQKALTGLLSLLLVFFMFSRNELWNDLTSLDSLTIVYDNKIKPEDYEISKLSEPAITVQPKSRAQEAEVSPEKVIKNNKIEVYWTRLPWLPEFIESKFQSLAMTRRGFRFAGLEAGSNIDMDIGFNSIKSIFVYLPRAAQIAFFAPFPCHWFSSNYSNAASPLMRRISALEMLITYFALIFLFYAIWHWRKRIEIWVISLFCISNLLINGLILCNVGTLYRMRYPFITTLVALGLAGFFTFLNQLKIKRDGHR